MTGKQLLKVIEQYNFDLSAIARQAKAMRSLPQPTGLSRSNLRSFYNNPDSLSENAKANLELVLTYMIKKT